MPNEIKFEQYLLGLRTSLTGSRRARRIENCAFQEIPEGHAPAFTCKDVTCPRCRKSRSYRIANQLDRVRESITFDRNSYATGFCTFTWRESATVADIQRELSSRRRHVVLCARECGLLAGVVVAEFTLNDERVHLHYHSALTLPKKNFKKLKIFFDAVGERNVDIQRWDGNVLELAKYFMPLYSYGAGVLLSGTKNMRISAAYGLKTEKQKYQEW